MTLDWEPVAPAWREARGPRMRPPSRLRTRLVAAALAVVIGLLVGVQAGERGGAAERLRGESVEDLTLILNDLNAEADRLARQISELRVREARLRSSAGNEEVLLEEARSRLEVLEVLSGQVPVRGPGVVVRIEDPAGAVSWDVILDSVQELRDAGAEAISVGDVRVVASTWFGPSEGGITVGGTPVRPPYELRAIGAPDAIREALQIAGGPLTLLQAQTGVRVSILDEQELRLPALHRPIRFRYARAA
ncbi:MAG TPA: DUF881 domain-containing protein [Actinomycetota bacterium]|nr:DUF881 domain-containing protein [Actinomycetota bacterium]